MNHQHIPGTMVPPLLPPGASPHPAHTRALIGYPLQAGATGVLPPPPAIPAPVPLKEEKNEEEVSGMDLGCCCSISCRG